MRVMTLLYYIGLSLSCAVLVSKVEGLREVEKPLHYVNLQQYDDMQDEELTIRRVPRDTHFSNQDSDHTTINIAHLIFTSDETGKRARFELQLEPAAEGTCDFESERCVDGKCKSEWPWQCNTGKCIRNSGLCDGIDDCGDGSDENRPPVITSFSSTMAWGKDNDVTLRCELYCNSVPPQWYHNGSIINFNSNRKVSVDNKNDRDTFGKHFYSSVLTLKSVDSSASGNYTCQPVNAQSSHTTLYKTTESMLPADVSEVFKFLGNTTHDDHFKLLLPDSSRSLLVGGRNHIYNLNLYDLKEQNRIEWYPESHKMSVCYLKGISEEKCQNYIRILTEKRRGEYVICGTHAYNPVCTDFSFTDGVLKRQREYSGRGICPFDPNYNNTSLYVDDQLYTGTTSDFSGQDPLIYREPLRTEQYDKATLNAPNFVSSFVLGDFVYFFFRESAVEYMNCGKVLYSRVSRVCRHDKGGPHKFRNKWTSYLKSRLNCSVGGEFPFYFNEIQATTAPLEGRYGSNAQTLIYGVFTTPENSIPGSAVCAFSFQTIMDIFEGPFKGQETINSNWLPVNQRKVPEPRPGQCVKDSSMLPNVTLNFIKSHSLMDEAVPAFFYQPMLISTQGGFGLRATGGEYSGRFTSIEVDPQVRTPDGKGYDVLFVGTDDGKVLKVVNTQSYDSFGIVEPFIIEELKVFEPGTVIITLKIIRPTSKAPRLLVTSRSQINSIPLWRCYTNKITSCGECLMLRDPYCAWDKSTRKCQATMNKIDMLQETEIIQSIASGTHAECEGNL